jgi:hypothetical protein
MLLYSRRVSPSDTKRRFQHTHTRATILQVHVQILTGRQIHLLLDVQDSLDDVREKILVKEGIHPDQQVLLFNGIKLMDGTVEELSIQEGAVLFLTLRNRGG